jgi:hypothetical protein
MAEATAKITGPGRISRKSAGNRPPLPPIVRIAQRLGRRIPAHELRCLPKDLSDQLDHYIYGTPKL